MNIKRVNEIINNREICDVYYNNKPVWIQEINNEFVKIGFMDLNKEINVNVNKLYEKHL